MILIVDNYSESDIINISQVIETVLYHGNVQNRHESSNGRYYIMYQLKLTFQTENNILPRELDRLIISFFKAAAENYSQEFFNCLYDKSKSILKTFTYSCYLPGAHFQEENIVLSQNRFCVFFSDVNLGQLIQFLNAFKLMKFKKYSMNQNSMNLISIQTQKRDKITDSEIVVKMQGALLVRRHCSEDNTDVYYSYQDSEFSKVLKENVEIFLEKLGMNLSTDGFSIEVVKGKKVVVPVFGRNTDASLGVYKIKGNPELLNVLYLSGMGVRRSEGHGKFEIVS